MENPKIYVKQDFLSADECDFLKWMAECQDDWDQMPGTSFHEKTIDFFSTLQHRKYASPALQRLSMQVYRKTQDLVCKHFGDGLDVDFMAVVRIRPGEDQEPHSYGSASDGRVAGCCIFLNSDFEGGTCHFLNFDNSIEVETGKAFVNSADDMHAYGISEVSQSTRYAIISTWKKGNPPEYMTEKIKKLKDYLAECCNEEQPVVKP